MKIKKGDAMEEKKKDIRRDIRNKIEYCIHNIPKETCVWCNPITKNKKKQEK